MKIELMRKIDKYLGIPLTFLLTILVKLKIFFFKRKSISPQRILFIELSEMGSAILADPAMRKAKNHFKAELFFLIFKKNKSSLLLLGTVPEENIFTLREDNLFHFIQDVLAFFIWSRLQKIDTVFDLELFSRATAILSALSGATYKVGYHAYYNEGLYRGNLMTHPVAYNPHQHIAKNFIALINALIQNDGDLPYSKTLIADEEIKLAQATITSAEKDTVRHKIQRCVSFYHPEKHKLILINPNASDLLPHRRWPRKHFEALIKLILAEYQDALILLTGAPGERAEIEILHQAVGDPRCVNFAGEVSFQELLPLYAIATCMITNDSGPGHFSAVTPLQTIVLFGPETPHLYGSLGKSIPLSLGLACSPCVSAANHRKTACQNNVCMQWLLPQTVMVTLKNLLSAGE